MYAVIINIPFAQLLDNSPKKAKFSKNFNSKFSFIEVLFTGQISKPPEIENKINITLVDNSTSKYKKTKELFSSTLKSNIWK